MSCNEWKETEIGKIPTHWDFAPMKEYVEINMGQSPKSEFYNTEGVGLPFLQGNRTFGIKYPYYDIYSSDIKKIAQEGDILFSVRAPVGDVNIATEKFCIGRGIASLRMKNGNQEYLYYLLREYRKYIENRESGTVFGSINKKGLEELKLPFPPKEEQEKIANILSSLDDKIELNNDMNKTLEEMAQSIFKRWFVDFEFPNEDGEPYKSSGGEMVDSELGMIPKGWEVKCLDDLASSISKGTTPTKKDIDLAQDEQTIKFLKVKDIDDNGNICIDKMENIPASVHYGKLKRSILHTGDIIFSIAGTIGKVCTIDERLNNSNMNQAVAFIRLDNIELLFGFILYLLKSYFIQNEIKANIVQAVQANVSLGTLKQLKFAYPNENILKMYNDIIMSIYKTQLSNKIEVENLIKVRDSLLPKLMSGEIMVK